MMQLDGKIALVTGGSRGIGRACVVELAKRGAAVTLVYRGNREAAESLVTELTAGGHAVEAVQADVRDGQLAQQIVDRIVEKHNRIDILVNSAGIVSDGLLGAMTTEQWTSVIETNLSGTYHYCRAVAQQMMYQRSGSIVNLSSTAAEYASRGQVNYAASKGGINGLTRGMAKEFAPRKVRVNAVAPGMIETDMSEAIRNLAGEQILKAIPMKRIGKPEEVAAVVAFLAGDEAGYVTGQILLVDGGLSLGVY
ncbi:MAG: 3-oxoacyl-ACP reductase FabG [Pirellulales bacterium]|jgi:3-oxoacyl-[acyl-carrier protein] reductase|nr:3-oxoacyl-ACP reductase FabG [Thermoguttaceae bacterium]MDD4786704.1 3-oxoacyl-ACP reductase FabG [Pirellulales bacterium]